MRFFSLCLAYILSFSLFYVADTGLLFAETVKEASLKRIQKTQRGIDDSELKKNNELGQLRNLELERMNLETELEELQTSLNLNTSTFNDLSQVNEQLRKKLENQLTLLEKITVLSYSQHKESWLKILFHIENTDLWYRNFAYYGYITAYQLSLLTKTESSLTIQETLLAELIETKETIGQQKNQLQERLALLQDVEQQRQNVIASLKADIRKNEKQLKQYNQQLKRVDSLAIELGNLKPDELLVEETNFKSLRGSLPLPTNGNVKITFQKNRSDLNKQSSLHNKGLVIATDYGSPVIAVARGNVIFSDWLGGFGLVLILDHGDDFMSLYAHNRQLIKKVGDWVDAGEVISLVGETGGRNKPELYFELRHKSKAVNPKPWLSHSG